MRLAWDAIRRRPGRSTATALGIGLATGLVVLLLSLSAGIGTSATRLAAASGIDLILTSANTSLTSGEFPPVPSAHPLPAALAAADPNIATSSPWLVASLTFGNASLFAAVNASANGSAVPAGWQPTSTGAVGWIPSDNVGLEAPAPVAGPGFGFAGDPHWANGSFDGRVTGETEIDENLAGVLHVDVGGLLWASSESPPGPAALSGWFANATPLRVVAITEPFFLLPSAQLAFLYLSELQAMLGVATPSTDYASLVLIHLTDPTDPGHDQTMLESAFPGLSVFTIANLLGAVQASVNLYRTFGTLVGAIGVVVATLFTGTVLLMSVDDRSREIALFRAVGFTRSRIGAMVFEEGLLLSLVGLAVGLVLGGLGAIELDGFLRSLLPGLPSGFSFVSFNATVIASGLLEVLAVGFVASIGPAARAMSFQVAEELRAP